MSGTSQQSLLDALPDAVFVLGANGVLSYANQSCMTLFGWSDGQQAKASFLDSVHPDDLPLLLQAFSQQVDLRDHPAKFVRFSNSHGSWQECEIGGAVHGPDAPALVLVARRQRVFEASDLDQRPVGNVDQQMVSAVLEHTPAILAVMTPDGRAHPLNSALGKHLGYRQGQPAEISFSRLISERDRPRVLREIAHLGQGQTTLLDAHLVKEDSTELLMQLAVSNLVNESSVKGYLIAAQIPLGAPSGAGHDASIGLLDRSGFIHEAHTRLLPLANSGQQISVLLFELDRMSQINDLLGAPVGARVIELVASRLKLAVRADDILGRVGEDEFALATVANSDTVLMLKERLLSVVAQAMNIDGHDLRVTASGATASAPIPTPIDVLLTDAANRLTAARGVAPSHAISTASGLAERRLLVEQLRLAVTRDELQPWFQPIVDQDASVVGYEALIRWQHPVRGILSPATFLPLVTMAGLDQHVEEIVLSRSLQFVAGLVERGNSFMQVHINVSPRQLSNEDFGRKFLQTVEKANVPLHSLCVEITETDILHVGASAINNLTMVRRAGVHVAIDDFGTGYSSLSHLLELPANCLKIDRRFIEGVGIDPMATGLTKAILRLTNSMGIECVAEGVELQSQHDKLVEFGCQRFQGWLYAAALPAEEALNFVCHELVDFE
jgi:diguanylate cyclase (GGDEF)-like protein